MTSGAQPSTSSPGHPQVQKLVVGVERLEREGAWRGAEKTLTAAEGSTSWVGALKGWSLVIYLHTHTHTLGREEINTASC